MRMSTRMVVIKLGSGLGIGNIGGPPSEQTFHAANQPANGTPDDGADGTCGLVSN
jgi:hypothetical protein